RSFLRKARVAAVLPALVTLSVPSPVAAASGPCYAAGDTEAEACLKCGAPAACGDPGAGMVHIEVYASDVTFCEGSATGVESVNCSNPFSCSQTVIVSYKCA
ncbi:MAG: hypothetical protein KC910_30470, partial [Candidatus Eremiobacteraeota bacterium]|nr:hypothetical protein [Candidatus Eremiobacteraeota bacterium]